jgi:hypothetical protein
MIEGMPGASGMTRWLWVPARRDDGALEIVIASEAKQSIAQARKNGLLRRFRLRSLSYGGQAAPRNDDETHLRIPAALIARVVRERCAPKTEGVGNAGCPPHPQPRVQNKTKHTSVVTARFAEITRHSRTQWF